MNKINLIIIGVVFLVIAGISALRAMSKQNKTSSDKALAIIFLIFGLLITVIGIFK